ncbi:MAG: alpha/beta hydrolase [Verrucomicrobiales bacterium]|nr:alpha/beta hydrolase [Verrucomicrobiales bacterium]
MRTLAVLFWAEILRWLERRLVYYPTRRFVAWPDALGLRFEDVVFRAADGVQLHGWFFPAVPGENDSGLVVLVCHGNGGNISHRLELYRVLLECGVAVFAFDYRGYGRSAGRPSEAGTYLDAQAAYNWLRRRGYAPEQIVCYGESLGGGVVSELAIREKVGGVVIQGGFSSLADIGSELMPWLPVRRLARNKYDTKSKLPQIRVPVLLMHSRADELIGFHHAEKNFAAANEPKLLCELEGDHNNPLSNPAVFADVMRKFLRLVAVNGRGGSMCQ